MSYVPLASLPSKESMDDPESVPSTPYPRRPSTFPLLHSRRASDSSTLLAETEDWLRLRQDRFPRRKIFASVSLALLAVLGTAALWAATTTEGGATSWTLGLAGRPKPVAFLLARPSKRTPPNFRRVLTNPLEPSKRLAYDVTLTLDSIPLHVRAGEPASLVVRCGHADLEQCAKAYRILFVGPTIRSTYHADSQVVDARHVRVTFRIDDPGEYQIYGWPEFETCDFWSREEFWTGPKFYKLAVGGTPFGITVGGNAPEESSRPCTAQDDLTGRWVAKSYLAPETLELDSPFWEWVHSQLDPTPPPTVDAYPPVRLNDYRKHGYVYTPYQCKIPHRSAFEWLDEVKPDSVLVIGDAITRDYFCFNLGVKDQNVCRYTLDPEPYNLPLSYNYREADKKTAYTRKDGGTTELHFHWNPMGWSDGFSSYISTFESPPTHVFFASTLWFTRRDPSPESYVEHIRPFLTTLTERLPNAQIITRTSSSAVQALGCWELANITRPVLEPVNAAYLKLLREEFPTVKVIDAYPIYNDRPEASSDGARWERVPGSTHARPEEGAVSHALTDLIFETWRTQR
ncbi:hypothetical protein JCM11491_004745 [Sporobolomyces phaffii]